MLCLEAFYLHGSDRFRSQPYIQEEHENISGLDKQYQRQCIFHRCRIWDCGFDAFNNNDHGENTDFILLGGECVGFLRRRFTGSRA